MLNALIAILLDIHIGMAVGTIYLHRGIAHGSLIFHPKLEHVLRFMVWLNGWDWPNLQQSYAGQHRKHHLYSDSDKDPHSPHRFGLLGMFDFKHTDQSRPYYLTPEEIAFYAPDVKTPDDWIQRKIYDGARLRLALVDWNQKFHWFDFNLSYIILFLIFWPFVGIKLAVFLVIFHHAILQRYLIPFFTNYLLHIGPFDYVKEHHGQDKSKILFPIGILLAGEELHANHHTQPWNPNLSRRWFEFDISWVYIRILMFFKLVKLPHDF